MVDDGRESPGQSLVPKMASRMRHMSQSRCPPFLNISKAGQGRGGRPPAHMVRYCSPEGGSACGMHTVPHRDAEPTDETSGAPLRLEPIMRDVALQRPRQVGINMVLHADVVSPATGTRCVCTWAPRDRTVNTSKLPWGRGAIIDFHSLSRGPRMSSFPDALPSHRPATPTASTARMFGPPCPTVALSGRETTKGWLSAWSCGSPWPKEVGPPLRIQACSEEAPLAAAARGNSKLEREIHTTGAP